MSQLTTNTTSLQAILDAVNALPEAGSGGSVETCTVEFILGSGYTVGNTATLTVSVVNEDGSFSGENHMFGTVDNNNFPPITINNLRVGSLVVCFVSATMPGYTIDGDIEVVNVYGGGYHGFIVSGSGSVTIRDDD